MKSVTHPPNPLRLYSIPQNRVFTKFLLRIWAYDVSHPCGYHITWQASKWSDVWIHVMRTSSESRKTLLSSHMSSHVMKVGPTITTHWASNKVKSGKGPMNRRPKSSTNKSPQGRWWSRTSNLKICTIIHNMYKPVNNRVVDRCSAWLTCVSAPLRSNFLHLVTSSWTILGRRSLQWLNSPLYI